MPIVHGLAHVGIRVHDLDRARAFYELLGFVTEGPVTSPNGSRAAFVRDPDRNVIELHESNQR